MTPVAEPAAPASPAAEPPAAPTADVPACLRAYEAGDQDSAERAAAGLARMRPGGKRGKRGDGGGVPLEQVALWSALALSRHARGDEVGGAAAFEAGARWAGAVTTRRIPASIDGLAPRLGRDLLTAAEALRHRSPGRRAALRLASTWLAATARERPGDGEASALAERAVGGFADAVTAEIVEQVARRDFAGAQGTLEDALAGIAVPEARRAELRDLPWTAITGEIGRLVGDALYGAGGGQTSGAGENGGGQTSGAGNADEQGGGAVDAMAALSAAARVVAEIPPDALTPERHHELSRRLWWAHLQVGGELRVRGQLDRAVAPLLRALELAAGDPPREAEARGAAALVIDALAERLGHDIRARLANGDVGGAMAASRRLGAAVDDALSRGLSTEDVAGALARRQEVLLELAEGRPA